MGVLHILQLVITLLSVRIKEPWVFYLLEQTAPSPKGTRHGDMPLGSLLISKLNSFQWAVLRLSILSVS